MSVGSSAGACDRESHARARTTAKQTARFVMVLDRVLGRTTASTSGFARASSVFAIAEFLIKSFWSKDLLAVGEPLEEAGVQRC